jgi:asparagine synthase (glutamine-hydrolysing)
MCGIAGFFDRSRKTGTMEAETLAGRMIDRLSHRGPDDRGVWVEAETGIALSHRRLSIIDLSPAGHQPMTSSAGRYVLTYNGEIFNWQDLRAELPPPPGGYKGHSDTEIFLRGVEVWGLAETVRRLIGFFALGLWDRQLKRLTLVRDRLGIKPLYWGQFGQTLLFGSELSALRAHPACESEIDRDALAAYLRTAYVPAPKSIYRGIAKLEPGTMLRMAMWSSIAIGMCATPCAPAPPTAPNPWPRMRWSNGKRCWPMRCKGGWWPMCRSAPSCRAAWIHRPSWR